MCVCVCVCGLYIQITVRKSQTIPPTTQSLTHKHGVTQCIATFLFADEACWPNGVVSLPLTYRPTYARIDSTGIM
jgi:hypothetical protein